MRRYVEVWVCPNDQCGNYYGSSSTEGQDLSKQMNHGRKEVTENDERVWKNVATFTRDRCPNCETPRVRRQAFIIGKSEETQSAGSNQEAV